MAMNTHLAEGELAMEINTTPLIDVMLVLLTLLVLTLPIQTNAIKLDMPTLQPPLATPPPSVKLEVDFDGKIYWDGTMVDRKTLDSYLVQSLNQFPQPEIHVSPANLASYDDVAMVLGDAQRLGVTKIGFDGIGQYAE